VTDVRDAVEALSAQLRADLAGVDRRIQEARDAVLAGWPSARQGARGRLLDRLEARVSALAASAADLARAQIVEVMTGAWLLGAQGVALTIGRSAVFDGTDTDAVASLAADAYGDVLAATRHIREDVKALVRVMARDRVADALVTGQGTAPAARQLAQDMAGRGITAITYVDGSRHGLTDYTDMLLRTKTAEAHQLGGFHQARVVGIEWMELLDGPGCGVTSHQDPRKANGLIVTVEEAARYPLAHPRCRRVATGRPDIQTPEDAASARPVGPQFSAEDIARGHADPSRTVAIATVRTPAGTLNVPGQPKAVRAHQGRVAKRVTVSASPGRP
jgi:hypothetical protein